MMRTLVRLLAPLALAVVAVRPASAQTNAEALAACRSLPAPDTSNVVVHLTPIVAKDDTLPARRRLRWVEAVARHFRAPAAADMPHVAVGTEKDGGFRGRLAFRFGAGGRLDSAWALRPSIIPAVDAAVLAAVRRADSAGEFALLGSDAPAPGSELRLLVSGDVEPPKTGVAVMRLRIRSYPVHRPPSVRHMPTPRYPPVALRNGVDGRVVMQFVIDTAGRAEPATIRVLDGTDRGFVKAAVETVEQARFEPARIAGGCPIRTLVQQPISFEMAE